MADGGVAEIRPMAGVGAPFLGVAEANMHRPQSDPDAAAVQGGLRTATGLAGLAVPEAQAQGGPGRRRASCWRTPRQQQPWSQQK